MHAIEYLDFSCRTSERTIYKECKRLADREGDYPNQLDSGIRFKDYVMKNRAEAENWIEQHDSGWYDNLAIKYKDGRKIMWLVKIEFHC